MYDIIKKTQTRSIYKNKKQKRVTLGWANWFILKSVVGAH